ncbi:hypothetical protein D3C81_792920 [compost metagenome]
MAVPNKRSLWVTSIQPYSLEGGSYIPTAVLFENASSPSFGHDALRYQQEKIVNNNFKLRLGEHSPGAMKNPVWPCQDGNERSAFEIATTFIEGTFENLKTEISPQHSPGTKIPAKVLVAEPLNFTSSGTEKYSKTWMQNYRDNIRRILHNYEEVEFLPEPFAVYQYYRYGQRLPHLQDQRKHVALVLDFGGGTFDACIIESTKQGDVSQTGKHAKPLSADSCTTGGFAINSRIAEYLLKKNLEGAQKKEAEQCISAYKRVKAGDLNLSGLAEKKQAFIENLKKLESDVETSKITLTESIKNWSLDAQPYERVILKVPSNPFKTGEWIDEEFFAHQFKKIFTQEIWTENLSKVISKVFKSAKEKLNEKAITVTLISGGSSNIRWLMELLERDFADELEGAIPVPISHSFQEVVSNGLAIECARRYYDEESEFVSVTYNPLKLHLRPDDEDQDQRRTFTSVGEKIDMTGAKPGDLMPSAQALHNFINEKLQWKIKLSRPPKSQLKYTYFKPGLDNCDSDIQIYNLESQIIHTRDNKSFDSYVVVELLIREDGTAEPSFIYKSPNEITGNGGYRVTGRPFAIDMTTGVSNPKPLENYIGFDFGSSCSSLCLLTQSQVKLTTARSNDTSWVNLSESINKLPFPVAFPLKKYLDIKSTSRPAAAAREAFEAALAFITYVAAAELFSVNPKNAASIFSNYQHRSMGPLKQVLRQTIEKLGKNCKFSKPTRTFLEKNDASLNKAIEDFNNHKHEKLEDKDFDYHGHLSLIISACTKLISEKLFGYVMDTEPKAFEENIFQGIFKVANDVPPFIHSFPYECNKQISRTTALLYDTETKNTLSLFPLIFWNDNAELTHGIECFWLDKIQKNDQDVTVKPCDRKSEKNASELSQKLPNLIIISLGESSKTFTSFPMFVEVEQE